MSDTSPVSGTVASQPVSLPARPLTSLERRSLAPTNVQSVLLEACRRLRCREEANVEDVRSTLALMASRFGRLAQLEDHPRVTLGTWGDFD